MYKWVSTWCRFSYHCCTSLTGACTSEYPWCRFSYHCCTFVTDACTSEYPDSVTAAVLPWRVHVQVSIQIQLPLLYFLDGCMYKWVSTWCRFSYRCCTFVTDACTSEYPDSVTTAVLPRRVHVQVSIHDADSVTAAVLPWRVHVQVSIHMMQIQLPLLYFLDGCMYKWVSMMQIQLPLLYFLDGCMYKWVSTWCRFSYRCCTS